MQSSYVCIKKISKNELQFGHSARPRPLIATDPPKIANSPTESTGKRPQYSGRKWTRLSMTHTMLTHCSSLALPLFPPREEYSRLLHVFLPLYLPSTYTNKALRIQRNISAHQCTVEGKQGRAFLEGKQAWLLEENRQTQLDPYQQQS